MRWSEHSQRDNYEENAGRRIYNIYNIVDRQESRAAGYLLNLYRKHSGAKDFIELDIESGNRLASSENRVAIFCKSAKRKIYDKIKRKKLPPDEPASDICCWIIFK